MKFSICFSALLFIATSNLVAQADNVAARARGRRTRGGQNERGLQESSCMNVEHVCEWESEDDPDENKYAICVTKDGVSQSKCVDADKAFAVESGDETVACGCCDAESALSKGKGFKNCEDVVAAAMPDDCDDPEFACSGGKGDTGVAYCASVKIGKGKSPTFGPRDECGDPFEDIEEERGEAFIACGACPSEMPSAAPSSVPSTSPSSAPSSSPSSAPSLSPSSSPSSFCDVCAATCPTGDPM